MPWGGAQMIHDGKSIHVPPQMPKKYLQTPLKAEKYFATPMHGHITILTDIFR